MIRVFPHRTKWTPTDEWAFIGSPPLFRPDDRSIPVKISVTFTWHKPLAQRLRAEWSEYYDNVEVGGPAYNDPGGEFTPGLFLKEGCTITSRGCPKKCGFCVVPKNEGGIRELAIKPGYIVQDNNLLACSEPHTRAVFDMLKAQDRCIKFSGGLDKHYLEDWHRPLFDSIKLDELWFACDAQYDLKSLEKASKILDGIPLRKRRCYTLLGYDQDETIAQAEARCERVLELGFMPFAQLYQDEMFKEYSRDWRALHRKWARPAAYMTGRANAQDEKPCQVLTT
jgi:hypothetical protein